MSGELDPAWAEMAAGKTMIRRPDGSIEWDDDEDGTGGSSSAEFRSEVWVDDPAPGGYVCGKPDSARPSGVCGMPVESEPCNLPHGTTES